MFKTGDRVTYIGNNHHYKNKDGTVVSASSDVVTIRFDIPAPGANGLFWAYPYNVVPQEFEKDDLGYEVDE